MSDPQRPPGHTPPRAEPVQPDNPTSGDGADADRRGTRQEGEPRHDPVERQAKQSRDAIDNMNKGFGKD